MFGGQLIIGTAVISLTVVIHTVGLAGLIVFLRSRMPKGPAISFLTMTWILVATVLGVFFLHAIEIWCWAVLYILLGEFDSLETAVYFSTVTFTTLGYGDITMQERWRILSSLEAADGLILFGVSTAFVFAVIEWTHRAVSGER